MLKKSDNKRTILIVDDEETICTITQLMLEKAGFKVITALDGMDAIRKLSDAKGNVDCVLLDHSMPNMNGEETFEVMKNMFPRIRVVMMSGYDMKEVSDNYSEKDIAGFIQKPYSQALLIQAIMNAISS
ncbi:MAG TPA: response regulator [Candidatus Cloacimonadota bacterium]|nr:response regulator [Candidatus Cloacimonadota bacterium]